MSHLGDPMGSTSKSESTEKNNLKPYNLFPELFSIRSWTAEVSPIDFHPGRGETHNRGFESSLDLANSENASTDS
jgi:hypothetical protein